MSYEAEVLADSPISYYRLGEAAGTEAVDAQGANKGTYQNAPTLGVAGAIPSEVDTAITVAAASKQYVSVPDSASLDFTDTVTYEVWAKRGTTGTQQTIIDKGSGSLIVRFTSGNKILVRRNSVANICESTSTLTDTTNWHHIVVTKTGATVKIDLDGEDVTGTVTNSTLVNNSIALGIGAADGGTVDYFDGSLDEVAVYGTALSQARVEAHHAAGITTPIFDFEVNDQGWGPISSAEVSRTTEEHHGGVAALKVVCASHSSFEGAVREIPEDFTPGERLQFVAWVKGPVGKSLRIRLEDDAGRDETFFEGTGDWRRVSVRRTIDLAATFVQVSANVGGTQTTTFYVDDAELALAPTEFTGDWESGDLSEWDLVQAIPGRVTASKLSPAQGLYSGRFEVQEGDEEPMTGSNRAEAQSGLQYAEGADCYFRLLLNIDSWDFNHWGIVWQIHDDSVESPPLCLQLKGTEEDPQLWLGPGDVSAEYWQAPIPLKTWFPRFEVVVHVVFGAKGFVEVWLQGVPQTLLNEELIFDEIDTLGNPLAYDKLGIYRSVESKGTAVVYHDDYRVTKAFFSEPPVPAPVKVKVDGGFKPATRRVKVGGIFVEA